MTARSVSSQPRAGYRIPMAGRDRANQVQVRPHDNSIACPGERRPGEAALSAGNTMFMSTLEVSGSRPSPRPVCASARRPSCPGLRPPLVVHGRSLPNPPSPPGDAESKGERHVRAHTGRRRGGGTAQGAVERHGAIGAYPHRRRRHGLFPARESGDPGRSHSRVVQAPLGGELHHLRPGQDRGPRPRRGADGGSRRFLPGGPEGSPHLRGARRRAPPEHPVSGPCAATSATTRTKLTRRAARCR